MARPDRTLASIASLLFAAGTVLALVGCDEPPPTASQDDGRPVHGVVVHRELQSDFPDQVGEIRSHVESDLGFKISGRIVARLVELGAVVHNGDVLALLDDQDQRNQLVTAQADLAAAQATLTQSAAEELRQAHLLADGWATQARYDSALQARDSALASVRAAQARQRLAEDQLGYATLRAPEDGAISAIGSEPGQVVSAGQMVVRLARLDQKDAHGSPFSLNRTIPT